MLSSQWQPKLAALLFAFLFVPSASALDPTSNQNIEKPGRLSWIERPWGMRYFMYLDTGGAWVYTKKKAIERNSKADQKYPSWEEFFSPKSLIAIKSPDAFGHSNLAVVIIEFDQEGRVTTPHSHKGPLRGRLSQMRRLGMSEGDATSDRFFDMAHWFLGLGDASTHWAPAFCNGNQQPDAAMVRSDLYLYGKLFKPNDLDPLFGCREWAYQLYDNERPYIDVTSYEPTSKGQPPKPYIREFIGWARFGDNKPVIGQHEGDWYCLHDCPGGDKPGKIQDIKKWAARFDWGPPIAPTRVPTFPDPPAESGTYPNEQKPLSASGAASKNPVDVEHKPDDQEGDFPDVPAELGC